MRQVLMVCTKFGNADNPWLTNELAQALAAQQSQVRVLHLDWHGESGGGLQRQGEVEVLHLTLPPLPWNAPRLLKLLWRWLFVRLVAPRRIPAAWLAQRYDLLIGFSPAIATQGLVRRFARRTAHRVLIYWDFFPTHQQQIGRMPGGILEKLAHAAEQRAVTAYTIAGCMSPANIAFFRHYFPRFAGAVMRVPVWGPDSMIDRSRRTALSGQFGFASTDVVCVFGGQLIAGRGIEAICDLADAVAGALPQVKFVIAGSGALETLVQQRAEGSRNLRYLGQLSREDYAELLAASDIGLVFTPEIAVPTFPSKTVDYFRAKLPILAAVESLGDYRLILEEEIGAGFGCVAGDTTRLIEKLSLLARDAALRQACGARGAAYYQAHMTASRIASALI